LVGGPLRRISGYGGARCVPPWDRRPCLGLRGFAWEQHRWPILLLGFLLCGLGIGFAVTPDSTVVAQLLPEHLRSNGFRVLGLVQSFGNLAATMVAGILWSVFSHIVAFLYAATWMTLSVGAAGWLRPPSQRPGHAIP
jgi:MFS family permease